MLMIKIVTIEENPIATLESRIIDLISTIAFQRDHNWNRITLKS